MESLKSKIGNKESEISQLAIGLAKETDDDVKDSIRQTIKEEKSVLKELEQSYNESRTAVSNFRNLSDQKVWTYEKFVNFLKKLRAIIKSRKDDVLLDKAIRMVFVNFSIEDDKVASYKLKPAFETLEKLTLVVSGVEEGEVRKLSNEHYQNNIFVFLIRLSELTENLDDTVLEPFNSDSFKTYQYII